MSNGTLTQLINDLPERNMTTLMLQGLDFVVPGQWTNYTNFDAMVRSVTGQHDPATVRAIAERANAIYADPSNGFQRVIWLYQTVDKADAALGAAALANRVGEKIGFLSFLNRLTPRADTAQTIDLVMKVAVELYSFCILHGVSADNVQDFPTHLSSYSGAALTRVAALICVDGIIPLGPDFLRIASSTIDNMSSNDLEQNPAFKTVSQELPGDPAGQLNFMQRSFHAVENWIHEFVQSRNITRENVTRNLGRYIDIADDKLDYLAAFLDMSTDYFRHTGTQTVATRAIEIAAKQI